MRVVLLENILSLGQRGEIWEVSDGYAMNYLLPQKKAFLATAENIRKVSELAPSPLARAEAYQKIYQTLVKQSLVFTRKVSDKGRLFQVVGPQDIVSLLADKYNISIRSKWLKNSVHWKSPGEYKLSLQIPGQPLLSMPVIIKAE